jgi:hypothetical protein
MVRLSLISKGTHMRTTVVAISLFVSACGQSAAPSPDIPDAPSSAATEAPASTNTALYNELSPLVYNAGMWSVLSGHCGWPEASQYEGAKERIYAANSISGDTANFDMMWEAGAGAGARMAERARAGEGTVACGAAVKQATLEELARITTPQN